MPGSDTLDLKRELRSLRAGLKTRDLVLAVVIIGVVTVAVLVKAMTGWPHFLIFGDTEQFFWLLGGFGQILVVMLVFTIRIHLGYDDLGDDDEGGGGASGSW